jgi:hypothetical protein
MDTFDGSNRIDCSRYCMRGCPQIDDDYVSAVVADPVRSAVVLSATRYDRGRRRPRAVSFTRNLALPAAR